MGTPRTRGWLPASAAVLLGAALLAAPSGANAATVTTIKCTTAAVKQAVAHSGSYQFDVSADPMACADIETPSLTEPFHVPSGVTVTLSGFATFNGAKDPNTGELGQVFHVDHGGSLTLSGSVGGQVIPGVMNVTGNGPMGLDGTDAADGRQGDEGTDGTDDQGTDGGAGGDGGQPATGGEAGSVGQGGAIYNAGTLVLEGVTFEGSSVEGGHGGHGGNGGGGGVGGTGGDGADGATHPVDSGCRNGIDGDAGQDGGSGGNGGDGKAGTAGGAGGAGQGGAIYNAAGATLTISQGDFEEDSATGGYGGYGGNGGAGGVGGFAGRGGNGGAGSLPYNDCGDAHPTLHSGNGGAAGTSGTPGRSGSGASGAGGGAGGDAQGGAIYNAGTLTISATSFSADSATGGNAGANGKGGSGGAGGNGAAGAAGGNGYVGTPPTDGTDASAGNDGGPANLSAGDGGDAEGGAIFNAGTMSLKSGVTFDSASATAGSGGSGGKGGGGGKGGDGGEGGTPGLSDDGNVGSSSGGRGGDGGEAGANGNGGDSGSAYGGAIYSPLGFASASPTFSGDAVTAGTPGAGGSGTKGGKGGKGGTNYSNAILPAGTAPDGADHSSSVPPAGSAGASGIARDKDVSRGTGTGTGGGGGGGGSGGGGGGIVPGGSPDDTAPIARLARKGGPFTTAKRVAFTWSAKDPSGIARYDLRTRGATTHTWLGAWSGATSTRKGGVSRALRPGAEICAEVRAHDGAGNVGPWTSPRCAARVLDDCALARHGKWKKQKGAAYLDGSQRVAKKKGAMLSLGKVRARRIALVVSTCKGCGKVTVSIGGHKLATVRLKARKGRHRVLKVLHRGAARKGRLVIKVRSTGKPVGIDAVGIGRA